MRAVLLFSSVLTLAAGCGMRVPHRGGWDQQTEVEKARWHAEQSMHR